MKIIKLVATLEDGSEVVYEGTGFITEPRSTGRMREEYVQEVTASITLPSVGKVTA